MVRRHTFAFGLAITLLAAGDAFAIAIVPTDLDGFTTGPSFAPSTSDTFTVPEPPPPTVGSIGNDVYRNELTGEYTYVHTIVPTINNVQLFNTGFAVQGFTGTAGFSFGDATTAGGAGAASFRLTNILGQLSWYTNFPSEDDPSGWDHLEPIRFFFVSTNPPVIGDYNLTSFEVGTGQSYAPAAIPEPGTIALLGSGLVGLYAARRRRRRLRA